MEPKRIITAMITIELTGETAKRVTVNEGNYILDSLGSLGA